MMEEHKSEKGEDNMSSFSSANSFYSDDQEEKGRVAFCKDMQDYDKDYIDENQEISAIFPNSESNIAEETLEQITNAEHGLEEENSHEEPHFEASSIDLEEK
jgi:hypothetical protein